VTPGSGGIPNTTGQLSGGPNTHWDATTGAFVPDTATSLAPGVATPNPSQGGGPATGTHWDPASGTYIDNTPAPSTTTGGGSSGSSGSSGLNLAAPFTGTFTPPTPTALPTTPTFTPPTFTAPTYDQAAADPGYQFAEQQANQAFMNNRAAAGVAGTGGTIKDFLDYNRNAASQQYTNVYNRDAQTWSMANQGATEAFAPVQAAYTTTAANTQHQNDVANTNAWNEYLQNFDIFDAQRKLVAGGIATSLQ
jgi:hypothetical protein